MSDNDFFFEDDQKAEPAPKAKPAGASAKKPAPSGAVTKKPAPKSSARPVAPRGEMVEQQSVTITIAVLIAVVALLVGMIVGMFIGRAMVPEVVSNPTTPTGTPMGGTMGSGSAPVLTDEQIEQGMPEGHPDPASTETTPAQ